MSNFVKGIDVSDCQGPINWAQVKEAGVKFAVLRSVRGSGKVDNQFYSNVAGCFLNKIPFDVYKYSYANTEEKAVKEANEVINLANEIGFEGTIWWDMEDKSLRGLSNLTKLIKIAEELIEAAGYSFGIYCNKDWYNNVLDVKKFDCPFWVARYPHENPMQLDETPSESKKPILKNDHELFGWQYSSKGRVPGINGNVDLDLIYLDLEEKEIEEKIEEKVAEKEQTVKIGHASIDERGKITGGNAGDQTGKELCTRNWYNKNWNFVLRPKTEELAEKSAAACEAACANNKIGYDQYQRNTLHTQAKKVKFDLSKITTKCECDCSSLMHVCALAGGANIEYGTNGTATINMKTRFLQSGDYDILTDKKYLNQSKYLKRGDILVKEGSHTVMVLNDGLVTVSIIINKNPYKEPTYTLYKGRLKMDKEYVKWLQWELRELGYNIDGHGGIDGIWGEYTEKYVWAAQEYLEIEVDGKVGPETRKALKNN